MAWFGTMIFVSFMLTLLFAVCAIPVRDQSYELRMSNSCTCSATERITGPIVKLCMKRSNQTLVCKPCRTKYQTYLNCSKCSLSEHLVCDGKGLRKLNKNYLSIPIQRSPRNDYPQLDQMEDIFHSNLIYTLYTDSHSHFLTFAINNCGRSSQYFNKFEISLILKAMRMFKMEYLKVFSMKQNVVRLMHVPYNAERFRVKQKSEEINEILHKLCNSGLLSEKHKTSKSPLNALNGITSRLSPSRHRRELDRTGEDDVLFEISDTATEMREKWATTRLRRSYQRRSTKENTVTEEAITTKLGKTRKLSASKKHPHRVRGKKQRKFNENMNHNNGSRNFNDKFKSSDLAKGSHPNKDLFDKQTTKVFFTFDDVRGSGSYKESNKINATYFKSKGDVSLSEIVRDVSTTSSFSRVMGSAEAPRRTNSSYNKQFSEKPFQNSSASGIAQSDFRNGTLLHKMNVSHKVKEDTREHDLSTQLHDIQTTEPESSFKLIATAENSRIESFLSSNVFRSLTRPNDTSYSSGYPADLVMSSNESTKHRKDINTAERHNHAAINTSSITLARTLDETERTVYSVENLEFDGVKSTDNFVKMFSHVTDELLVKTNSSTTSKVENIANETGMPIQSESEFLVTFSDQIHSNYATGQHLLNNSNSGHLVETGETGKTNRSETVNNLKNMALINIFEEQERVTNLLPSVQDKIDHIGNTNNIEVYKTVSTMPSSLPEQDSSYAIESEMPTEVNGDIIAINGEKRSDSVVDVSSQLRNQEGEMVNSPTTRENENRNTETRNSRNLTDSSKSISFTANETVEYSINGTGEDDVFFEISDKATEMREKWATTRLRRRYQRRSTKENTVTEEAITTKIRKTRKLSAGKKHPHRVRGKKQRKFNENMNHNNGSRNFNDKFKSSDLAKGSHLNKDLFDKQTTKVFFTFDDVRGSGSYKESNKINATYFKSKGDVSLSEIVRDVSTTSSFSRVMGSAEAPRRTNSSYNKQFSEKPFQNSSASGIAQSDFRNGTLLHKMNVSHKVKEDTREHDLSTQLHDIQTTEPESSFKLIATAENSRIESFLSSNVFRSLTRPNDTSYSSGYPADLVMSSNESTKHRKDINTAERHNHAAINTSSITLARTLDETERTVYSAENLEFDGVKSTDNFVKMFSHVTDELLVKTNSSTTSKVENIANETGMPIQSESEFLVTFSDQIHSNYATGQHLLNNSDSGHLVETGETGKTNRSETVNNLKNMALINIFEEQERVTNLLPSVQDKIDHIGNTNNIEVYKTVSTMPSSLPEQDSSYAIESEMPTEVNKDIIAIYGEKRSDSVVDVSSQLRNQEGEMVNSPTTRENENRNTETRNSRNLTDSSKSISFTANETVEYSINGTGEDDVFFEISDKATEMREKWATTRLRRRYQRRSTKENTVTEEAITTKIRKTRKLSAGKKHPHRVRGKKQRKFNENMNHNNGSRNFNDKFKSSDLAKGSHLNKDLFDKQTTKVFFTFDDVRGSGSYKESNKINATYFKSKGDVSLSEIVRDVSTTSSFSRVMGSAEAPRRTNSSYNKQFSEKPFQNSSASGIAQSDFRNGTLLHKMNVSHKVKEDTREHDLSTQLHDIQTTEPESSFKLIATAENSRIESFLSSNVFRSLTRPNDTSYSSGFPADLVMSSNESTKHRKDINTAERHNHASINTSSITLTRTLDEIERTVYSAENLEFDGVKSTDNFVKMFSHVTDELLVKTNSSTTSKVENIANETGMPIQSESEFLVTFSDQIHSNYATGQHLLNNSDSGHLVETGETGKTNRSETVNNLKNMALINIFEEQERVTNLLPSVQDKIDHIGNTNNIEVYKTVSTMPSSLPEQDSSYAIESEMPTEVNGDIIAINGEKRSDSVVDVSSQLRNQEGEMVNSPTTREVLLNGGTSEYKLKETQTFVSSNLIENFPVVTSNLLDEQQQNSTSKTFLESGNYKYNEVNFRYAKYVFSPTTKTNTNQTLLETSKHTLDKNKTKETNLTDILHDTLEKTQSRTENSTYNGIKGNNKISKGTETNYRDNLFRTLNSNENKGLSFSYETATKSDERNQTVGYKRNHMFDHSATMSPNFSIGELNTTISKKHITDYANKLHFGMLKNSEIHKNSSGHSVDDTNTHGSLYNGATKYYDGDYNSSTTVKHDNKSINRNQTSVKNDDIGDNGMIESLNLESRDSDIVRHKRDQLIAKRGSKSIQNDRHNLNGGFQNKKELFTKEISTPSVMIKRNSEGYRKEKDFQIPENTDTALWSFLNSSNSEKNQGLFYKETNKKVEKDKKGIFKSKNIRIKFKSEKAQCIGSCKNVDEFSAVSPNFKQDQKEQPKTKKVKQILDGYTKGIDNKQLDVYSTSSDNERNHQFSHLSGKLAESSKHNLPTYKNGEKPYMQGISVKQNTELLFPENRQISLLKENPKYILFQKTNENANDTRMKYINPKSITGRKLFQFSKTHENELIEIRYGNSLSLRRRRSVKNFPKNSWCEIPYYLNFKRMDCTVWTYRKECVMTCFKDNNVQGSREVVYKCARKKNVWEPKIPLCGDGADRMENIDLKGYGTIEENKKYYADSKKSNKTEGTTLPIPIYDYVLDDLEYYDGDDYPYEGEKYGLA